MMPHNGFSKRSPHLASLSLFPSPCFFFQPHLAKWALTALWDAATGRYLARQAAAAWRASRSPSPPRHKQAGEGGARLRARG